MNKDVIVKLKGQPLPGWPCPNCAGHGHMSNGAACFTPNEIHIRRPTRCPVCEGRGRVLVMPLATELRYD